MDQFETTAEVKTPLSGENSRELAEAIAEVLDSKKGRDIKVTERGQEEVR